MPYFNFDYNKTDFDGFAKEKKIGWEANDQPTAAQLNHFWSEVVAAIQEINDDQDKLFVDMDDIDDVEIKIVNGTPAELNAGQIWIDTSRYVYGDAEYPGVLRYYDGTNTYDAPCMKYYNGASWNKVMFKYYNSSHGVWVPAIPYGGLETYSPGVTLNPAGSTYTKANSKTYYKDKIDLDLYFQLRGYTHQGNDYASRCHIRYKVFIRTVGGSWIEVINETVSTPTVYANAWEIEPYTYHYRRLPTITVPTNMRWDDIEVKVEHDAEWVTNRGEIGKETTWTRVDEIKFYKS